jgi:predicted RNA-binding protein with PUA domain
VIDPIYHGYVEILFKKKVMQIIFFEEAKMGYNIKPRVSPLVQGVQRERQQSHKNIYNKSKNK